MKRVYNKSVLRALTILLLAALPLRGISQKLEFVVHADPVISWMGSNASEYQGEGAKAGFDIGLNVLHFFAENYAVSSGISFISAGGRQSVTEDHFMVFTNLKPIVTAGDEIKYNLHYMNIPLGVRLQTNQIGYLTYFTDIGFDIRMLLKSTVDLPKRDQGPIKNENAKNEVYGMNAGWHITVGIEYELGIETSLIAGLGFGQDFFDFTKDLKDANQPKDRSGLRMVKFRLGVKF